MAKIKYTGHLQESEKEFLKLFDKLTYSRSAWQVWEDLMTVMACSISNAADRTPDRFKRREEQYGQAIKNLGCVEIPAQMLAIITMALEENQDQDFLGKLYMNLNLGSHWHGQFFTPYQVCQMMAGINFNGEVQGAQTEIKEKGYISVHDPCVGAGAMLVAFANTMKKLNINYQTSAVFVGQDIDRIVAMMTYIQLSLIGCPGYIIVGDSLTNPMAGHVLFPQCKEGQEIWITPMFLTDVWTMKRQRVLLEQLCGTVTTEKTVEKEHFYMFFYFDKKEGNMENKGFNGNEITGSERKVANNINSADIKKLAKEKLAKEMEADNDRIFAEAVIGNLIEQCEEDLRLAQDVMQKHKTWEKCLNYIYGQARKQAINNRACVCDNVIHGWVQDYYHKNDKIKEEKKDKKRIESQIEKNKKNIYGQINMFSMIEI